MENNTYEWDLSKFCIDDETWYERVELLGEKSLEFEKYEGMLHNKEMLKEYYELSEKYNDIFLPLFMYAENHHNKDLQNQTYVQMSGLLGDVSRKVRVINSFYESEMLLGENCGEKYLLELMHDSEFEKHILSHENLLKDLPHTLSKEEERIVSRLEGVASGYYDVFSAVDNVDMRFEDAIDNAGNKHSVTNANYIMHMQSKDRTLRKNVFESWKNGVEKHVNTLSTNFINNLHSDWAFSEIYKYPSVLNNAIEDLDISEKTYNNLMENIANNLDLNKQYYSIRKKMLGYDKMYSYDAFVPLVDAPQTKLTFPEAFNMVKAALAELGTDYTDLLEKAVKERWIDAMPTTNKIGGAYSWSCYGYSPVVLLNFAGTINDTFIIAHEMGHALNDVYTQNNQPKHFAQPRSFLTEVASTTNEVLMLKHLINNAKTLNEKIYYLDSYCGFFTDTLFAQTKLTEFEEFAHGLVEQSKPISKDILEKHYQDLVKKYTGEIIEESEKPSFGWLAIPHFFRPFYCFQYATGITAAVCLASKIYNNKENAVENFKTFLSSGGKNKPNVILKEAGVDLETNQPYNFAFAEFKWAMKELEMCLEKSKHKYSHKKTLVNKSLSPKQNKTQISLNNTNLIKPPRENNQ